jgi:phosphate transport system substrate-binding protein
MSQNKNETLALSLTLLMTLSLAGGGVWYYTNSLANKPPTPATTPNPANNPNSPVTPPNPDNKRPVSLIATPVTPADPLALVSVSLPNPQILAMDGSVTMIRPVKRLQNLFAQKFPNLASSYGIPDLKPNGTNKGLTALINKEIEIAASSRPLNATEIQAELVAVPVAKDALAIVIGVNNPFKGELTMDQLRGIYQGKITNWKEVGGENRPIKVINRSKDSGTHSLFRSVVLEGQEFPADNANFITWARDETTPILRQLGNNGISYTTVSQAIGQELIRIVSINGISPTNVNAIRKGEYALSRNVFLVVRRQVSASAKEFIELALSPNGQKVMQESGFISLE